MGRIIEKQLDYVVSLRALFLGRLHKIICFLDLLFSATGSMALDDGTWTYDIDGDSVKISGCSGVCPVDLVIPNTIAGKSVATIGYGAFSDKQLTSVTIPDSVISIGEAAFEGNKLANITLPASLIHLRGQAFDGNQLTSVVIPDSVQSMDYFLFANNPLGLVHFLGGRPAIDLDTFSEAFGSYFTYCLIREGEGWPGTIYVQYYPEEGDEIRKAKTPLGIDCDSDNDGVNDSLDILPFDASEALDTDSDGEGNNADLDDDGDGVADINDAFPLDNFETVDTDSDGIGNNADTDDDNDGIADALDDFPLDDSNSMEFEVNGDNIKITGCKDTCPMDLVIPSTIEGKNVTSIGYAAFRSNDLTSVTIPGSVIEIGTLAFSHNQLTSVTIPDSVTTIGIGAFNNNQLTSATIPESVTNIVFQSNWTELTSEAIPDTVSMFGMNIFYGNSWTDNEIWRYFILSNEAVVMGCSGSCPRDLVIPEIIDGYIVTGIGVGAFDSNQLTSVTIPDSVTTIEAGAFANNQLKSVILPGSLMVIGGNAFWRNQLTNVILPDGLIYIDSQAFQFNELNQITIPASVKALESGPFSENYMGSVHFLGGRPFMYVDETFYDLSYGISYCLIREGEGWPGIIEYEYVNYEGESISVSKIPTGIDCDSDNDGVKDSLDVLPFDNTEALDTDSDGQGNNADADDDNDGVPDVLDAFPLDILESIDTDGDGIGNNADTDDDNDGIADVLDDLPLDDSNSWEYEEYVDGIKITGCKETCSFNLVIPHTIAGKNVTSIGNSAFTWSELTSVIIPDSVINIGSSAFDGNRLTSVTIPDSVKSIDMDAFAGNQLATVTIGNSVSSIGWGAFSNNQLTNITIPDSVISIDWSAFSGNQLSSVTIGKNVESIGYGAFDNHRLTDILPISFAFLGDRPDYLEDSFSSISGRSTVTYCPDQSGWPGEPIPVGNKNITPSADCGGLNDVPVDDDGALIYFRDEDNVYVLGCSGECSPNIVVPQAINGFAVTVIAESAFENQQLTSVIIPDTVINIGDRAFQKNQLRSVTIPNSVTSIGSYAFSENLLTSITIPDSVISIASYTFSFNQLNSVTIPNSVTIIGNEAFKDNKLMSVILPDRLINVGHGAFRKNKLTNISIPQTVLSIGNGSFHNNKLSSVTIPASVLSVGINAFNKNNLLSVTFLGQRPTLNIENSFSDNYGIGDIVYCAGMSGWPGGDINSSQENYITPVVTLLNNDSDCDGVPNSSDAFPGNPYESADTDTDGVGNNADTDDDNDGILDSLDAYPLDSANQPIQLLDVDGNGQFDALTDSLLITRYGFGFTGEALINGAVAEDATRTSSEEIEAYLELLIPEL